MNIIPLFERVALTRDHTELGLRAGDVATLLDYVAHPGGGAEGCVLEIFNALGDSMATVIVPVADIERLRPDEVLTVRAVAKAG